MRTFHFSCWWCRPPAGTTAEPLLKEAETALLCGRVVPSEPLGQYGPADADGDAGVLELPDTGAQSGSFLLPVPAVAFVVRFLHG